MKNGYIICDIFYHEYIMLFKFRERNVTGQ